MPARRSKQSKSSNSRSTQHSLSEIVEMADQAVLVEDPIHALSLYTEAAAQADGLELADILEKRAIIKVSVADQDGALEDFKSCVELIPAVADDESPAAVPMLERKAGLYMYMGQLSQGEDALVIYGKAIELLQKALNVAKTSLLTSTASGDVTGANHIDPKQELTQQLAAAYCTTAELFLTDMCYEENAEQECETYIQKALQLTSGGEPIFDALQTCASLRLSQCRALEATELILQAYQQIHVGCEALASLVGMKECSNPEGATELTETTEVQNLPGYECRCQSAKILLECAYILKEKNDNRLSQCVLSAVNVVGSLMAENDEVVETWILAGDAFAAADPAEEKLASYYWTRAVEMLETVEQSLQQQISECKDHDEEDVLNQELEEIKCQIEAVQGKLNDLGVHNDIDD